MRRALLALALVVVGIRPLPAQQTAPAPAADQSAVVRATELDRLTDQVASELRCVVCQGLSIQDSPSALAQEMRSLVREQLATGKSPDEVKEYFVAKYGEWVLLQPKARGFNLVVYLMPVALFLGGAAFIFFTARRWTRQAPAAPADDDALEVPQY